MQMSMEDFKRETYDPRTGAFKRQWIRYGDGVYEPVRKHGEVRNKWSDPHHQFAWWVEDKPSNWMPKHEGAVMSLNHNYGEKNKPSPKKTSSNTESIGTTRSRQRGKQIQAVIKDDLEEWASIYRQLGNIPGSSNIKLFGKKGEEASGLDHLKAFGKDLFPWAFRPDKK